MGAGKERMVAEALLRPREVARMLSIGVSSVYRLAESATLPTVRVPGTNLVRFRRERVEVLLRRWETNTNGRWRKQRRGEEKYTAQSGD